MKTDMQTPKHAPDASSLDAFVAAWVEAHPLEPAEADCALAVMLKILDGKCKMREAEKRVMTVLYRHVRHLQGERLPAELHALVQLASERDDGSLKEHIYEKRVLAETMISRPVMKRFKARIRQEGLLGAPTQSAEEEELA